MTFILDYALRLADDHRAVGAAAAVCAAVRHAAARTPSAIGAPLLAFRALFDLHAALEPLRSAHV